MKVQMIYECKDYCTELDRPQEIKEEEFNQKTINEWLEIYFKDNEVVDEIEKERYGFKIFDDEMNWLLDTLYYKI